MKKVLPVGMILACIVWLISCKKSEVSTQEETLINGYEAISSQTPCQSGNMQVRTLETEYGCTNTAYTLQANLSNTHTVITNATQYASVVTSSTCNPAIDFNVYDVVVGKKQLQSGLGNIKYELNRNCATNTLTAKVTFNTTFAANAPNVTYQFLIPKLSTTNSSLQVQTVVQ